ncbi:hypothetical protein B0J14DRAFT_649763 [Halenospora varia]|nr:hypothetical protein B0J14DRAFT_649763 [Halenospora varia]
MPGHSTVRWVKRFIFLAFLLAILANIYQCRLIGHLMYYKHYIHGYLNSTPPVKYCNWTKDRDPNQVWKSMWNSESRWWWHYMKCVGDRRGREAAARGDWGVLREWGARVVGWGLVAFSRVSVPKLDAEYFEDFYKDRVSNILSIATQFTEFGKQHLDALSEVSSSWVAKLAGFSQELGQQTVDLLRQRLSFLFESGLTALTFFLNKLSSTYAYYYAFNSSPEASSSIIAKLALPAWESALLAWFLSLSQAFILLGSVPCIIFTIWGHWFLGDAEAAFFDYRQIAWDLVKSAINAKAFKALTLPYPGEGWFGARYWVAGATLGVSILVEGLLGTDVGMKILESSEGWVLKQVFVGLLVYKILHSLVPLRKFLVDEVIATFCPSLLRPNKYANIGAFIIRMLVYFMTFIWLMIVLNMPGWDGMPYLYLLTAAFIGYKVFSQRRLTYTIRADFLLFTALFFAIILLLKIDSNFESFVDAIEAWIFDIRGTDIEAALEAMVGTSLTKLAFSFVLIAFGTVLGHSPLLRFRGRPVPEPTTPMRAAFIFGGVLLLASNLFTDTSRVAEDLAAPAVQGLRGSYARDRGWKIAVKHRRDGRTSLERVWDALSGPMVAAWTYVWAFPRRLAERQLAEDIEGSKPAQLVHTPESTMKADNPTPRREGTITEPVPTFVNKYAERVQKKLSNPSSSLPLSEPKGSLLKKSTSVDIDPLEKIVEGKPTETQKRTSFKDVAAREYSPKMPPHATWSTPPPGPHRRLSGGRPREGTAANMDSPAREISGFKFGSPFNSGERSEVSSRPPTRGHWPDDTPAGRRPLSKGKNVAFDNSISSLTTELGGTHEPVGNMISTFEDDTSSSSGMTPVKEVSPTGKAGTALPHLREHSSCKDLSTTESLPKSPTRAPPPPPRVPPEFGPRRKRPPPHTPLTGTPYATRIFTGSEADEFFPPTTTSTTQPTSGPRPRPTSSPPLLNTPHKKWSYKRTPANPENAPPKH